MLETATSKLNMSNFNSFYSSVIINEYDINGLCETPLTPDINSSEFFLEAFVVNRKHCKLTSV